MSEALAVLLPLGQQQFFDANGNPLSGGSVTFYVPNTMTLKNTWQDAGQITLNTNPVVLDASGSATIYGSGDYVQVVRDIDGTVQWTKATSSSIIFPTIEQLGGAQLDGNNVWTGFNQFNAPVTIYGAALNWSEAPTIASAAEINLQEMPGNKGSLTLGTPDAISSVILNQGAIRFMRFLTPISLTAGPLFVMPTGLTAAEAGDCCIFEGEAGGRVRISIYQRANGGPVNQASPSGSASSSISGNSRGLKIVASPGVGTGTVTCEAITLRSVAGLFATGRNLSMTFNSGSVGVNGLESGTVAADTWYAVMVISNGTGTFGTLLCLDPNTPILPTGYTLFTRVGWVRTSATPAAFYGSRQSGQIARWMVDGTTLTSLPTILGASQGDVDVPDWVEIDIEDVVPPTGVSIAVVVYSDNSGGAIVAPNDNYGAIDDGTNPPIVGIDRVVMAELLLETFSIFGATESGAGIFAYGWTDT